MQFSGTARTGTFLRRYKRFFADVRVDDREVVAHLPNTGSLLSCLHPGLGCVITETDDPKRKLKATLHLLETPTGWVGVNTSVPNRLVFDSWRLHPEWEHYGAAKAEYKLNANTRLDLVLAHTPEDLKKGRDLHYVEIKSVTYAEGNVALFPDAVTARGQKHLTELIALTQLGRRAEILFVVQRSDVTTFAPAAKIDPAYARLLRDAHRAGVRVRALRCAIDTELGVSLELEELPVRLI